MRLLVGDLALVTSAGRRGQEMLFAFDLADPTAPQQAGRVTLPAGQAKIAAMGDTLLLGNEAMGLVLL